MREVTAPIVSTPWEGSRTSSTSKTNAKAIKARPIQLGESEPAAKKKSNSAMPPAMPGKIAPGCEISTYRPIRATTNKRKVTFGSCIRADIMILLHSVIQRAQVCINSDTFIARYFSGVLFVLELPFFTLPKVYLKGGRRTSTESCNFSFFLLREPARQNCLDLLSASFL